MSIKPLVIPIEFDVKDLKEKLGTVDVGKSIGVKSSKPTTPRQPSEVAKFSAEERKKRQLLMTETSQSRLDLANIRKQDKISQIEERDRKKEAKQKAREEKEKKKQEEKVFKQRNQLISTMSSLRVPLLGLTASAIVGKTINSSINRGFSTSNIATAYQMSGSDFTSASNLLSAFGGDTKTNNSILSGFLDAQRERSLFGTGRLQELYSRYPGIAPNLQDMSLKDALLEMRRFVQENNLNEKQLQQLQLTAFGTFNAGTTEFLTASKESFKSAENITKMSDSAQKGFREMQKDWKKVSTDILTKTGNWIGETYTQLRNSTEEERKGALDVIKEEIKKSLTGENISGALKNNLTDEQKESIAGFLELRQSLMPEWISKLNPLKLLELLPETIINIQNIGSEERQQSSLQPTTININIAGNADEKTVNEISYSLQSALYNNQTGVIMG